MLEASERADQLTEDGDCAAANIWHRILDAIERRQVEGAGRGREGRTKSGRRRIVSTFAE
jgi:hypothetical protein